MKIITLLLSILLVMYVAFVKLPQLKCAEIAQAGGAAYSFSAVRGCELQKGNTTWLLTPGYLRRYGK